MCICRQHYPHRAGFSRFAFLNRMNAVWFNGGISKLQGNA